MLHFLKLWKVSDGKGWFIKGFGRFGCQSLPELPNHYFSLSNWCSVKHFGAQGAQKHQSFQTISFHYQIDALGSISELKAPRAPKASLFIIKSMSCEQLREWENERMRCRAQLESLRFPMSSEMPKSLKFLWFIKDICEKVVPGRGGYHIYRIPWKR